MTSSHTRDDPRLTPDQIDHFARVKGGIRPWQVRSMAQELRERRQWDAPQPTFATSAAEQQLIIAIRALNKGSSHE